MSLDKSTKTETPKGYLMEELLRSYFLRSGYYVVRGVPFSYEGFDVTDIDIWLYSRTSSISREITIIDSKNKKTPQAIERIFWIQGLKIATKATNAIVATTDRRPEVKDFGRELGVGVLDGNFLRRLSVSTDLTTRISDEEFQNLIIGYALNKLDGDWKGRIKLCKSLLASELSFDSCNEWLAHAKFFAEHAITNLGHREVALRCLYLICSFIAIGIDYSMREIVFHDQADRTKLLKEGFTYGAKGLLGIDKIINVATKLIEENINNGNSVARQIKANIQSQFSGLNTGILAEHFSKTEVSRTLFFLGKEFETLAMNKEFVSHASSSPELRAMLFCCLDFWGIDRVVFSKVVS